MTDGEADYVGFDVFKRAQVAVSRIEHHAHAFLNRCLMAARFAQHVGQLREVFCGQRIAIAKHRRAEQYGLKLADITGPIIDAQQRQRAISDPQRTQAGLLADPGQEMPGQGRNIARAFAQRRQVNRHTA